MANGSNVDRGTLVDEPHTQSPSTTGAAISLALAIGNALVAGASALLVRQPQETVPAWMWAGSFLWLASMGPAIVPFITVAFAARDMFRGRAKQASWATAIAIVTAAMLWSRVEIGF
jgi:hypothetical protein